MSIPIEAVREIAQMLKESGLHEIVIESSESAETAPFRLKVRRDTSRAKNTPAAATSSAKAPKAQPASSQTTGPETEGAVVPASQVDVASTAVGILRAPATALAVGDKVKRKQVIAIVESMKIPNEILAPADGTVTEILARPESGVEYGQILLRLEPDALS